MANCGKCYKDDCSGQCEMDRFFEGSYKDSQIYAISGFSERTIKEDLETIEKLSVELPDVDYILDNIVYYMFTNHVTTGDYEEDKKLDEYLHQVNFNGQRNIDVLKGVAKGYRKYGYYGLLNTKQGLVGVHPAQIVASIVSNPKIPVLRQTLAYIIQKVDQPLYSDSVTRVEGWNQNKFVGSLDTETVKEIIKDPEKYKDQYYIADSDEFACVRIDTSKVFGVSPLLKDRKRITLILNILDRMNYDIVRNGIGTIALKAKTNLLDELEETAESGVLPSAGQLLDMGRTAREERERKVAEDMQALSDKLATTAYNDALIYPSRFSELKQLTRDTRAIDFIDYLSQYVSPIIAQLFGVPARLFDLGKTVSNIGTHSIIDNAMRNNIIPMREQFIGQCSPVLKKAIGLKNNVTFASYEFTRDYNYENDLKILEAYRQLKEIDIHKAETYLEKNLIV